VLQLGGQRSSIAAAAAAGAVPTAWVSDGGDLLFLGKKPVRSAELVLSFDTIFRDFYF
jgi:hypothetical protein